MTVENCIKLLSLYKERMTNPSGAESTEEQMIKVQSKKAYENMKNHILTARKFVGHPILDELREKPKEEVVETPKPKTQKAKKEDTKSNDKKSKR